MAFCCIPLTVRRVVVVVTISRVSVLATDVCPEASWRAISAAFSASTALVSAAAATSSARRTNSSAAFLTANASADCATSVLAYGAMMSRALPATCVAESLKSCASGGGGAEPRVGKRAMPRGCAHQARMASKALDEEAR